MWGNNSGKKIDLALKTFGLHKITREKIVNQSPKFRFSEAKKKLFSHYKSAKALLQLEIY